FKNDLYCLFVSSSALAGSTEAPLVVSINVVEPGEDVTLTSPCHSKIFHWYKQRLGYTMDTVALNVDNRESSKRTNDSRITVSTGKDCTLTIRNVSKDDEATYFCFSGTMFRPSFASGIFLADLSVKLTPEIVSIQQGDQMSLQCSLLSENKLNSVQCPGVDEVYWFRSETGSSHPGFIYTQGNREDERKSCVHTFCTLIGRSSDAGTSYCTEAMCGEILFGEGTTVDVKSLMIRIWSPSNLCHSLLRCNLIGRHRRALLLLTLCTLHVCSAGPCRLEAPVADRNTDPDILHYTDNCRTDPSIHTLH
uniref:Immunoglobulin domain-containing protein n=1 Tax=Cynoglossus semilaevis TaxID=244447 RepID=A0A3P8UXX4_CYNSE